MTLLRENNDSNVQTEMLTIFHSIRLAGPSRVRPLGKALAIHFGVLKLAMAIVLVYFLYGSHASAPVPYNNLPLD